MKKVLFLLLVVFSVTIFGQTKFPAQCKIPDVKFTQDHLLLFSKKITPRVYAITNIGKHPIWLNHEKKNPGAGMGAGFASQLYPNHWSALLVDGTDFLVSCQQQNAKGIMVAVTCQKVLRVCQFKNIHTAKLGEYWLVENVIQSQLMPRIKERGL
ncbi:MAG: hypothetical protein Q8L78_03245 [Coxiellaceae bacterium]|nr:hypothetical protein [Coxiellaceae bacterium]